MDLTSRIQELSKTIADQITDAVKQMLTQASMADIMSVLNQEPKKPAAGPKKEASNGRLQRRTTGDIEETLGRIVKLLKSHPNGLRSEAIRSSLQLEKREMPKPLATGLATGVLSKKGERRSTTYRLKESDEVEHEIRADQMGDVLAEPRRRIKKKIAAKRSR